jgi:hypothetical protein
MAVGRNCEPLCDNTGSAPENCLIELPDTSRSHPAAKGQQATFADARRVFVVNVRIQEGRQQAAETV